MRQAASLYSYEWFPIMKQFIEDQHTNFITHNSAIDTDMAEWKAELAHGIEQTTDSDEKQHLQDMLGVASNIGRAGKSGKFWAYVLFRYLTSLSYLSIMEMKLTNGNTSQSLS